MSKDQFVAWLLIILILLPAIALLQFPDSTNIDQFCLREVAKLSRRSWNWLHVLFRELLSYDANVRLNFAKYITDIDISIYKRGCKNYYKIICISVHLKYDFYFFFQLSICVFFPPIYQLQGNKWFRHNVTEAKRHFDIYIFEVIRALSGVANLLLHTLSLDHFQQHRLYFVIHFSAGYSEDSDYTSDLNYPVGGQGANSSASQFRTAANQLATPQRSLETSRENSYERDDHQVLIDDEIAEKLAQNTRESNKYINSIERYWTTSLTYNDFIRFNYFVTVENLKRLCVIWIINCSNPLIFSYR